MGTPTNISEILATLPGGKAEEDDEEPDWLKELEEDEASGKQGSQSSDDPFAFLHTPGKSPLKVSEPTPTPGEAAKSEPEAESTPKPQSKSKKPAAAAVKLPARVTIKNPDKISFTRLLVELPHKDSDCVDLSGDTGAVGRFTFCNRVRSHQPERLSETAVPPSAAAVEGTGDEAGPSATAQVSSGDEGRDGEDDTEEALVLDLKGVKFDAKITALAGTACVVNIGPSGAKVEAVFNEFVQLDETSMFEDYEQVTDGTLEGWALADPEDVNGGDGVKPSVKQPKKAPLISSGRVSKATKRKPAGKSRTPQKAAKKKR